MSKSVKSETTINKQDLSKAKQCETKSLQKHQYH